jgi:hypothetical protein
LSNTLIAFVDDRRAKIVKMFIIFKL